MLLLSDKLKNATITLIDISFSYNELDLYAKIIANKTRSFLKLTHKQLIAFPIANLNLS